MNQAPRHSFRARCQQTLGASPGSNVARLLRGAWRDIDISEPANDLTETELNQITPLLCLSGSGALAWWKIRNTPLANTVAGQELHEVYRRFRLSALIHEREIAYVFSLLRAEGIEAVLVKGWAIARRYPDRALRPYGDIDLCIAPDQFEKAQRALRCLENIEGHHVDLHVGFGRIGRVQSQIRTGSRSDRVSRYVEDNWDELFSRSSVVECGGEPVRVLCDEDHLRILSLHLLRSGAWRPLWLCDVALLLEQVQSPMSKVQSQIRTGSQPGSLRGQPAWGRSSRGSSPTIREGVATFDWDICLGRNRVHANWVVCAIKLAHQVLDANIENTPFAGESIALPRWLVPAVLKQWGRTRVQSPKSKVQSQIRTGSRSDRVASLVHSSTPNVQNHLSADRHSTLDIGLWTSLYSRWDNPIRSTAAVGGKFNNWPRLPYRLAESLMRLPELPTHLRLLFERNLKSPRRSHPQITPITQKGNFESVPSA